MYVQSPYAVQSCPLPLLLTRPGHGRATHYPVIARHVNTKKINRLAAWIRQIVEITDASVCCGRVTMFRCCSPACSRRCRLPHSQQPSRSKCPFQQQGMHTTQIPHLLATPKHNQKGPSCCMRRLKLMHCPLRVVRLPRTSPRCVRYYFHNIKLESESASQSRDQQRKRCGAMTGECTGFLFRLKQAIARSGVSAWRIQSRCITS